MKIQQQKHLIYVFSCSHEEPKLTHGELIVSHGNLIQNHAFLTKTLCNEETKHRESLSFGLDDQLQNSASPCDVSMKKNISNSCDVLLAMPCSLHIYYICLFLHYMFVETNLVGKIRAQKSNEGFEQQIPPKSHLDEE